MTKEQEAYRVGWNAGQKRGLMDAQPEIERLTERNMRLDGDNWKLNMERKAYMMQVANLKVKLDVSKSFEKIAHNDINAFLLSEDRMKEEINLLRKQKLTLENSLALSEKYNKEGCDHDN